MRDIWLWRGIGEKKGGLNSFVFSRLIASVICFSTYTFIKTLQDWFSWFHFKIKHSIRKETDAQKRLLLITGANREQTVRINQKVKAAFAGPWHQTPLEMMTVAAGNPSTDWTAPQRRHKGQGQAQGDGGSWAHTRAVPAPAAAARRSAWLGWVASTCWEPGAAWYRIQSQNYF